MPSSENIGLGEKNISVRTTVFLLVLVGIVPNLSVIETHFLFDDISIIVTNPYIRSARGLLNYLDAGRPIRSLTLFLDYSLWGYNPRGYHLTNLILHVSCAVALFRLLDGRFMSRWTAWGAAALFSVHPATAEPISVVSHRKEMLALLFLLLGLIFYLKASRPGDAAESGEWGRFRKGRFILSFMFYLLGLGSKQVVIILPLIAFMADFFLSGKSMIGTLRRRWWAYGMYVVLPALFMLMAVGDWRVVGFFPREQIFGVLHWKVLAISGWSVTKYVEMLAWPIHLSADHQIATPGAVGVSAGFALWLVMLSGGTLLRDRSKAVAFGLVWIPLNLLMVMNIIPANQPLADRYLYIPMAGFCIIISGLVEAASSRDSRLWAVLRFSVVTEISFIIVFTIYKPVMQEPITSSAAAFVFAVLSAVFVELLLRLARRGRESPSFLRYVLFAAIGFFVTIWIFPPAINLAASGNLKAPEILNIKREYRFDSRVQTFQTGKRPSGPPIYKNVNQIVLFIFLPLIPALLVAPTRKWPWIGDSPRRLRYLVVIQAIFILFAVLEIRRLNQWGSPRHLWSSTLREDPSSIRGSINLGVFYKKKGKPDRAMWYYRRATDINPRHSAAWYDLGLLYLNLGMYGEAADSFRNVVALDRNNAPALLNLGNIYYTAGDRGSARNFYLRALAVEPDNAKALFNMAIIEKDSGNDADAFDYCEKALSSSREFHKASELCGPGGKWRTGRTP